MSCGCPFLFYFCFFLPKMQFSDTDGDFIVNSLKEQGVGVRYIARNESCATQVAFLPVYASGERACIVVPGASSVLDVDSLLGEVGLGCRRIDMVREMLWFNLGYPFELPNMQGSRLVETCAQLKHRSVNVAVSLDLNGASSSMLTVDPWLLVSDALPHVCLVHMNWDEACAFAKKEDVEWMEASTVTVDQLKTLAQPFLDKGVAIVTITLGRHGAFVCVHAEKEHVLQQFGVAAPEERFVEEWCATGCVLAGLPGSGGGGGVDTVGAGDSFVAGMLLFLERMAAVKKCDVGSLKGGSLSSMLAHAQRCAGEMIGVGVDGETKE